MYFSKSKKNNVHPRKPQFYYIKVRFKGVSIIQACFRNGKKATESHKYCHSCQKWTKLYQGHQCTLTTMLNDIPVVSVVINRLYIDLLSLTQVALNQ